MLNYLGPNIGSGPVTNMLPPATPGTMPSGIPGAGHPPSAPASHGNHIMHKGAPPSHHALSAILNSPVPPGMPLPPPPPPPEYGTTTQADGSVLLHIKNPDGTLGPVVKLLPPIKTPGAPAPGGDKK